MEIPPLVYHGFTAEGRETVFTVNVPTELYNCQEPDEERLPYDTPVIPYQWPVRHG